MKVDEAYLKERLTALTQKRTQQMQHFQQLQSQVNMAQAQINATEGAIMDVNEMLDYAAKADAGEAAGSKQEVPHAEDTSQ